jgi:hypothetical protein
MAINTFSGGNPINSLQAAGKNKILNSDFSIWQRGTTVSASNTYAYLSDRWQSVCDGNFSGSRQTFTPGAAPVTGYEGKYFFRYTKTSGTYWQIQQPIEDVQTLAGQTATISFWAKVDAAKTVYVQLTQNFGSGGSASVTTSAGTQALTTSWVRYSFTVAVPSISGKTIGTSSNLALEIGIGATTGNITLDIWGVQVELGTTATTFTTATGTIQGELAACQRYYQRLDAANNSAQMAIGPAWAFNANGADMVYKFPVEMRIAPTVLDYSSLSHFQWQGITTNSVPTSIVYDTNINSRYNAGVTFNKTSGYTSGGNYFILVNSSSAYIGFGAEL